MPYIYPNYTFYNTLTDIEDDELDQETLDRSLAGLMNTYVVTDTSDTTIVTGPTHTYYTFPAPPVRVECYPINDYYEWYWLSPFKIMKDYHFEETAW